MQITRTWFASDACGNTGLPQDQIILVKSANQPPVLILHEIDVYLNELGKWGFDLFNIAAMTAGSHSDCEDCGDLYFILNPPIVNCHNVFAPVEVTIIAMDEHGNAAFGKTLVNVYDTIAPVALCKDTTIYLDK